MHSCDLSAQVYKQEIAVQWGDRITEEFKRQSDREASLKLPRTLPESYEEIDVMKSQIGFVSKIVKPLWDPFTTCFPPLAPCLDRLEANEQCYKNKLVELQAAGGQST